MGHRKLKKFRDNENFSCLLQPDSSEILNKSECSGLCLRNHSIKGNWNLQMFDKPRPIILELGCGRGEYTIDLAERNPEFNYIGVDIKGARLWQGAKYATEKGLRNVAFLRTRIEFIEAFFGKDEISEIWLTFSDPQIKSENKRLTSPLFIERYRNFLRNNGIVHLKTDSLFLHQYTKEICNYNKLSILVDTNDLYGDGKRKVLNSELASIAGKDAVEALFQVQTYYERLFLSQSIKITYMAFLISGNQDIKYPIWEEEKWKEIEGKRRVVGMNLKM